MQAGAFLYTAGGGGTVGSGDCAFSGGITRSNSGAFGLGTGLDECSSQLSD